MTTQLSEEVLAKVRKILAKAEDPAATPEEADTYTAKAAELIAAYGIDRALLAEHDPGSDRVTSRVVVLVAPYALDKSGLLSGVASALRCQAVQRTRYDAAGAKEISMHLFGFESDLVRAEVLYTSLLLQATTSLQRTQAPPWESVAAYRRTWLAGFTSAVVTRLRQAETRAEARAEDRAGRDSGTAGAFGQSQAGTSGGRSVSLVLADRSREVGRAVREEYPYLRQAGRRQLSGSGRGSGYRAGERADLGGARLGGRRRQLGR